MVTVGKERWICLLVLRRSDLGRCGMTIVFIIITYLNMLYPLQNNIRSVLPLSWYFLDTLEATFSGRVVNVFVGYLGRWRLRGKNCEDPKSGLKV